MKIHRGQKPVQSHPGKELSAEHSGKESSARRNERQHLADVPQICASLAPEGINAVSVLFQKVAGNALKIAWFEKCPEQGFGPAGRVCSRGHVHPFNGHARPCHKWSTVARASLSARTPLGCSL